MMLQLPVWQRVQLKVKLQREEEARKHRTKQTSEMMDGLLETLFRDREEIERRHCLGNPKYGDYFKIRDLVMEVRLEFCSRDDKSLRALGYVPNHDECVIDVRCEEFVRYTLAFIGKRLHKNEDELLELFVSWMSRYVTKGPIDVVKEFAPHYRRSSWLQKRGSLLWVVMYVFVMGARDQFCDLTKQDYLDFVELRDRKFIWMFLEFMRTHLFVEDDMFFYTLVKTYI